MTPLTCSAYLPAVPSTTPDQGTILLYVLSTLAQTCAALAAFVGAVGIYRLQSLTNRRRDLHARIHQLTGNSPNMTDQQVLDSARKQEADIPGMAALLDEFYALAPVPRSSGLALVIFEAWNLLVIGASLVGFNYVPLLVSSPWTFWAVWVAAVGTVSVTAYSVYAWTRR